MKIPALIVVAGLGLLALPSCAPPPPSRLTATATTHACNTTGTALNPVAFVLYGYTPQSNTTPQPDPVSIQQDIQSDLNAAFAAASPAFQAQICNLNGIFIDPTGCSRPNGNSPYAPSTCNPSPVAIANNSWGMRQYDAASGTILGRYVGLSLGMWNNAAGHWTCPVSHPLCAPPFQGYQTAAIQATLATLSPAPISPANLPSVSAVRYGSNGSVAAISVLANLAHESGHIAWYDTFVSTGGGAADPNAACPAGTQFGQFYIPTSAPNATWKYAVDVPPGRWLSFGQLRDQSVINSPILTLPGFYSSNNFRVASASLFHLYGGAQWASPLAAFSPDEDFVETFELTVLASANPPLTSMLIAIPGFSPYDALSNLIGNTELARKYLCIAGALPLQIQRRPR